MNDTDRGEPQSATLPTINPTWSDPDANLGLCNERLETNRLSNGMAKPSLSLLRCVQLFPINNILPNLAKLYYQTALLLCYLVLAMAT